MLLPSRCWQGFVFVLVALVPTMMLACEWDYDTLQQERSRFPSTLELITGKFLRHSPEFYRWRINDRLERLKSDPQNLALHDDLAVAYRKVGEHARAIEVIQAKDKIKPGVYETYSNWGTFLILNGELEQGLPLIDKALAINSDAHFGREKYQKWLVEYALTRSKNGKITLPLRADSSPERRDVPIDFRDFLNKRSKDRLKEQEERDAVKGILGMMRFANHDNPLLLEALGDLLLEQGDPNGDAKQLAARSYLKASQVVKDEAAVKKYRQFADEALVLQTGKYSLNRVPLKDIEVLFKRECADADAWYAKLREQELGWIQQGKNVDVEFDKLYTTEPKVKAPQKSAMTENTMTIGVVAMGALLIGATAWRWRRTPRRMLDDSATS